MSAPPWAGEERGTVGFPSSAYQTMAERWDLIHDLWGGTRAMRAAGSKWLPANEAEATVAWERRRDMTILYDVFRDTASGIVDRPFSHDITFEGEESLDARVLPILTDADRQRTSLTSFARAMLLDAVLHGMTHVLVDFPTGVKAENAEAEKQAGIRPYLALVSASDLLEAKPERTPSGVDVVKRVRIKSQRVEPDGTWGDRVVKYVKVIEFGNVAGSPWQLWRKDPTTMKWEKREEGTHDFIGVPFVTLYLEREGFMLSNPPLDPLAWQCLRHWQSTSDQNSILHISRFAQLLLRGFSKEDAKRVELGPYTALRTDKSPQEADASYIQAGGPSIEAGFKDIAQIEDRLQSFGAEHIDRQTGTVVATARALTEVRETSAVQSWLRAAELTLMRSIEIAHQWYHGPGYMLPEEFKLDIYNEFSLGSRSTEDLATLDRMHARGKLSDETMLRECQRRGTLAGNVDIDAEVAWIEEKHEENMELLSGTHEEGGEPGEPEPESGTGKQMPNRMTG